MNDLRTRPFVPVFLDVPEAGRVLERYADELRSANRSEDAAFVDAVAAGKRQGRLVEADPALVAACREVAKMGDAQDAADWKDNMPRLIRQCRAALEPYPEPATEAAP